MPDNNSTSSNVETRQQKRERLFYVLEEMDINQEVIEDVVVTKGIKSISLLCSMADEDIKNGLDLTFGNAVTMLS